MKFSTIYSLVPRFEHYLEKESLIIENRNYEADGIVWSLSVSNKEKNNFLEFSSLYERDGFKVL
jgi:hypothetical protein